MLARADIHNHSCLSPCADLTMSPRYLAAAAKARGLDIVALTDHNASLNCPAFAAAAARNGIIPLFGVEMNSQEEAHILAVFASPREALEFGERLDSILPFFPAGQWAGGDQAIVDEKENLLDLYGKWLGAALEAGFGDLAALAAGAGALVVPAHVDRAHFSVFSQLGFLPEGPYDAVESMREPSPSLRLGHCAVSSSDAHYPEDIGRRSFTIDMPEDAVRNLEEDLRRYCALLPEGGEAPEMSAVGYRDMLSDPSLGLYPEKTAREFMEAMRRSLRAGEVVPSWKQTLRPGPRD